ncbi:hypothetical protein [Bacillus multifaciens]|nr:hypothetical protein [Bacillus sp. WLY-B-L8]HDX9589622.1 hypothetical protein [Bacillus pseudomycoides]
MTKVVDLCFFLYIFSFKNVSSFGLKLVYGATLVSVLSAIIVGDLTAHE